MDAILKFGIGACAGRCGSDWGATMGGRSTPDLPSESNPVRRRRSTIGLLASSSGSTLPRMRIYHPEEWMPDVLLRHLPALRIQTAYEGASSRRVSSAQKGAGRPAAQHGRSTAASARPRRRNHNVSRRRADSSAPSSNGSPARLRFVTRGMGYLRPHGNACHGSPSFARSDRACPLRRRAERADGGGSGGRSGGAPSSHLDSSTIGHF
jgi:hypothetical protein